MATATITQSGLDFGMVQIRVEVGSLVAVGCSAAGRIPARWAVSRVLPARGVRWTLPAMESGQIRGIRKAECRKLAAVLCAVERGRITV